MSRLLILCACLILAFPLSAQERHALVVGIDRYAHVEPLQKAVNDARAMAAALEAAGFRVDLRLDTDETTLLTAISQLAGRAGPGDEVVVFFAGHGIEVDGRNYLLPADVPALGPGQELVMRRRSVPLSDITDALTARQVRVSLLILDACRNNPFPREGTRSLGGTRGLARVDPPQGSFVIFSAGAGQEALDRLGEDDRDPNSVFTRALLPRLAQPGLDLRVMVQQVRSEVRRVAMSVGHDQFPAFYDQLDGSFMFRPAALEPVPPQPPQPDLCATAEAVWSGLRNSEDMTALMAFATAYATACPELADAARARLAALLLGPKPDALPEPAPQVILTPPPPEPEDRPLTPAEMTARGEAHFLGSEVPQSDAEALRWFRLAAEAGDAAAMNNLGWMYRNGRGVEQSDSSALRWYHAAAAAGDARSMNNLGLMYRDGTGVAQDDAEALRWFRASAEAGHPAGMNTLGWMYAQGRGVAQNDSSAVRWFRAAAEAGHAAAMSNLGFAYERGRGVGQSDAEAMRWFRAAAEAGSATGLNNMARMYEAGRSVPRDPARAAELYLAAARGGVAWFGNTVSDRDPQTIREVQRRLRDTGHYTGGVDGRWGPLSQAAFEAFLAAPEADAAPAIQPSERPPLELLGERLPDAAPGPGPVQLVYETFMDEVFSRLDGNLRVGSPTITDQRIVNTLTIHGQSYRYAFVLRSAADGRAEVLVGPDEAGAERRYALTRESGGWVIQSVEELAH